VGARLLLEAFAQGERSAAASDVLRQLKESPPGRRRSVLTTYVATQLANALGSGSASTIGPDQRLIDLGIDSLIAIELRNRLQVDLGGRLAQTVIFDYPTLRLLVDHLESQLLGGERSPSPAPPAEDAEGEGDIDDLLDEIGVLTDSEVKNRLAEGRLGH
jgi:acyl carrier protein